MALGPKTENAIEDGHGNTQIGHNTGSIKVGLTFAEHQAAVKEALAEKRADLERAHEAERGRLQDQVDELHKRLANIEDDYEKRLQDLEDAKALLARYQNQLGPEKRDAANAALDRGDTTLARALFTELAAAARNRKEDAEREEAELEFELGKLAEAEIRWADAAAHYARAARLNESFDTLRKAWEFAHRSGDMRAAQRTSEDLLDLARRDGTQEQLGNALNCRAVTVWAQGRYPEAERPYRQALEIGKATVGAAHPDYATDLNNLAGVVRAQGRYAAAETLYRQALEIHKVTIGAAHPGFAIDLNNLAGVVEAQGRYPEAETLYRQALEIDTATIGEAHPDYATALSNLAVLYAHMERFEEALPLIGQALAILEDRLGPDHPDTVRARTSLANMRTAMGG